MKNFTEITLEDQYSKSIINIPKDGLNIDEMIQELVIPLLKAAGYHENSIKNWIDSE